jgi:hypothetical protein
LGSIRVAAGFFGGPNNFTVYLAAAAGGSPGAALETFSSLAFNPGATQILTLNSTLHPLLSSGLTYWVVMAAADPINSFGGWALNDQGINGYAFRTTGAAWSAGGGTSPAFDVNDAVPEPSSIGLALVGLAAILWRRRSRA